MNANAPLKVRVTDEQTSIMALKKAINEKLVQLNRELQGRRVRILAKQFNGQPYGSSAKPLYGKVCIIKYVMDSCEGNLLLQLETENGKWLNCTILFDGVELL